MKLDAVKVVFILGAAQDIFPAVVAESGLISARDRDYLSDYLQFRNMDVQLENEDWFFICKKQPQLIYAAQQNGQYFSLPEMTEFIALHPTFNAKLYAQIIELIKKQPAAAG